MTARLVFRADASHAIGFGHVARLCALVEHAAARGYDPVVLFGGDSPSLSRWLLDRALPGEVRAWTTTDVAAAAAGARALFVDGPHLATELARAGCATELAVIDDVGGFVPAVAAVVNHNVTAPDLAASYPGAARTLLGRRYLMLRRDIAALGRACCRPLNQPRLRVVISYGSSDPVGATTRTLRLVPADRPLELVALLGPGFREDAALHAAAASAAARGHTVELLRSPREPGAVFASADAAICAAGGTLGELAYLGCPAFASAIVADQIATARQQASDGLVAGGAGWSEISDADLTADFARFVLDDAARAALRDAALATADERGPARIFEAMGL